MSVYRNWINCFYVLGNLKLDIFMLEHFLGKVSNKTS